MINEFIDLIFPRICVGCTNTLGVAEKDICILCMLNLPKSNLFFQNDAVLANRFLGKSPIKYILTYVHYQKGGIVQHIMHEIKYKNNPNLGKKMGLWFGEDLRNAGFSSEFDLILSVPLHANRLKKRGYNQSDFIANGLSESLNIPFDAHLLKRYKDTQTQLSKSKLERFENMENVFGLSAGSQIEGKRILLVDDTLTTSATLSSCANVLFSASAKEVSVLALAAVD